MPIDILARAPNISTTPLIILRWITACAQLFVIMGSEVLFGIPLPAKPLLMLVAASFAVNLFAMSVQKRRNVPEEAARWYLAFDILQLCGFLVFTGGIENPFSVLLLAPLAMAASILSLYSLCLLIIFTVLCVSVMSFIALPLAWPAPAPVLSPSYRHGIWFALTVALVFISFIVWRLAAEARRNHDALVHTSAILDEKRRLSALGALAAAAVHELGSPLGTIAVVTKEMELDTHPDDPLAEDIALLRAETEKCKRILADLATNPDKKMAEGASAVRLDRMLMEIATEQGDGGRGIRVEVASRVPENLPFLAKSPGLEYGIGNLVGNALSYARAQVRVNVEGTAEEISVTITDDGPGFTPQTLQIVGQPYISTRDNARDADGSGHMGLGIFIAINLLEASGARLVFTNGESGGARVQAVWPRSALEGPGGAH